jgi:hypothetical protein
MLLLEIGDKSMFIQLGIAVAMFWAFVIAYRTGHTEPFWAIGIGYSLQIFWNCVIQPLAFLVPCGKMDGPLSPIDVVRPNGLPPLSWSLEPAEDQQNPFA